MARLSLLYRTLQLSLQTGEHNTPPATRTHRRYFRRTRMKTLGSQSTVAYSTSRNAANRQPDPGSSEKLTMLVRVQRVAYISVSLTDTRDNVL